MKRELNELKKAVAGTNTALSSLEGTVKGLGAAVTGIAAALERTNGMLNRTMISVARMDGFSGLLLESPPA